MNKYKYLDSVRGIACLIVVFSHLSLTFFPYLHNFGLEKIPSEHVYQEFVHNSFFSFFISGTAAVYVFFILSGIVLTKSMEYKTNNGYLVSIISRYPRLMFPALLSCIITYLLYKNVITEPNISLSEWFDGLFIKDPTLQGAFYFGAIKPFFSTGSLYNNVLWTMRTELIGSFYIYFFSYLSIKHKNCSTFLFLLSIPIVYFLDKTMILGIGCFFFGFLIFKYNLKVSNNYATLMLLLFGLYLAGAHNNSSSYSLINYFIGNYTYIICNFFAAIFIVFSIMSNNKIQGALSFKLLYRLGDLSFPIYLLHLSVIAFVCNFIYPLLILHFEYAPVFCAFVVVFLSFIVAIPMSRFDFLAVKISKKIADLILSTAKRLKYV